MFMFRDLFPVLLDGEGGGGGNGGGNGGGEGGAGGSGGEGGSGAGQGSGGSGGEQKPPWGSDEEFNPDKAWKLLQNVRGDLDKIKGERDQLRTKVQEHERANESAQEKVQREKQEAEQRATTAEGQALRLDVALEKAPDGMSIAQVRKLAKRLSGKTREELVADAEELFADFQTEGNGSGGQASRGRPKERLRSGAGGSGEPDEDDPEKLAAKVPRLY